MKYVDVSWCVCVHFFSAWVCGSGREGERGVGGALARARERERGREEGRERGRDGEAGRARGRITEREREAER